VTRRGSLVTLRLHRKRCGPPIEGYLVKAKAERFESSPCPCHSCLTSAPPLAPHPPWAPPRASKERPRTGTAATRQPFAYSAWSRS
jgi:hypothetical protein